MSIHSKFMNNIQKQEKYTMMEDIEKCMKMISKDSTESTYQQIE